MKLLFLPSALLVLLASCGPNKHVNACSALFLAAIFLEVIPTGSNAEL